MTGPRRWFVTAQFHRVVRNAGAEVDREPGAPAHAKEMGTTLTACGLDASTWMKFWYLDFHTQAGVTRCPACTAIVVGTLMRSRSAGAES
jgi:hypothetical protein